MYDLKISLPAFAPVWVGFVHLISQYLPLVAFHDADSAVFDNWISAVR